MPSAEEITQKAQSNLAFAFGCLPKEQKKDMVTFYAFCRVIDDLADDLNISREERKKALKAWYEGIKSGFIKPDTLQREVSLLIDRYNISAQPFLELIDGCSSDLDPQRFHSWDDLSKYTYRVASCVGVISTHIFGCTHPDSHQYAITLGHALQLTNIIRDVGEDLDNGKRIYLPLEDLHRFNYSEEDLVNRIYDERFTAMMHFQANRAEKLYTEATSYIQPQDTKALQSAEAMKKIYYALLQKMRKGNFQVFQKRYSVSKIKKAALLLSTRF